MDRIHKKARGRVFPECCSLGMNGFGEIGLLFFVREKNVFSWPNSKHAAWAKILRRYTGYQTKTWLKLWGGCSLSNIKPHNKKIKPTENSLLMFSRGATVKVNQSAGFSGTLTQEISVMRQKAKYASCSLCFHFWEKKSETRTQNPEIGQTVIL